MAVRQLSQTYAHLLLLPPSRSMKSYLSVYRRTNPSPPGHSVPPKGLAALRQMGDLSDRMFFFQFRFAFIRI